MSSPYAPDIWTYLAAPNGCPAFFPPGKTPTDVVISFTGIQRGPAWLPGDLEPPNREFTATNPGGGCAWTFNDAGYLGIWVPNPVATHLECNALLHTFFIAPPSPNLEYSLTNLVTGDPGDVYQRGTAAILNFLTDTIPTIETIADYINFFKGDASYASSTAISQQNYVVRLDRRIDATSIKLKYDNP
jgi:hypothetical protein